MCFFFLKDAWRMDRERTDASSVHSIKTPTEDSASTSGTCFLSLEEQSRSLRTILSLLPRSIQSEQLSNFLTRSFLSLAHACPSFFLPGTSLSISISTSKLLPCKWVDELSKPLLSRQSQQIPPPPLVDRSSDHLFIPFFLCSAPS